MYRLTIILITVLLLAVSSNVYAQDNNSFKSGFNPKSENNALLWSLAGTAVPICLGASQKNESGLFLVIGGVFIGPSLGYFYGDEVNRGLRGIGIRTGLAAATLLWVNEASKNSNALFAGLGESIIGMTIIFIHDIYDIASVKSTIRKHNEELLRKNQTSVTLMPKYFADSGAGGLELRINF